MGPRWMLSQIDVVFASFSVGPTSSQSQVEVPVLTALSAMRDVVEHNRGARRTKKSLTIILRSREQQ